jgi:hypothetical protein
MGTVGLLVQQESKIGGRFMDRSDSQEQLNIKHGRLHS